MRIKDFGLQAGQDAEVLRVALEPAVLGGHFVERAFAVVPVWRMPDIVRQPGHVDQIRIAAQPDRHAAADLSHLKRVRQPGAWGVTLAGPDHLRLVGQSTQRGAVQHPRPVAGEVGAVLGARSRQRGTLRLFESQTLPVEVVVSVVISCHRRSVCQSDSAVLLHRPRIALD